MAEKLKYRYFQVERDQTRAKEDSEKRLVRMAFSSEHPVLRSYGDGELGGEIDGDGDDDKELYYEILSHDPDDVDLTRLKDGAPLLDMHDLNKQVGVVEHAEISDDKMGRAVARFGKSKAADEVWNDVQDGIRKHVSVGYQTTRALLKTKGPDGIPRIRFAWQPYELSIVSAPEDPNVGIGRSVDGGNLADKDKRRRTMNNLLDHQPAASGGGSAIDENALRAKAQADFKAAYSARKKELRSRGDAIIKDFPQATDKVRGMVDDACETEENIDSVSFRMLKEAGAIKPVKPVTMTELGMSDRDQNEYSILRGIQSCIKRNFSRIPDGLEGDVHKAMEARKIGIEDQCAGFMVPADAPVRTRTKRKGMTRDMQVNIFGQGGAAVATTLQPVIEILRNRMVTDRLGVMPLSGLEGMIAIPRQTGAGTAYAVSEIAGLTLSNQQLDQIPLSPKRVGAYGQYSKQLLLQSAIDIENFIRDDLLKVIAIAWDRLILNGSGANSEPLGIMQTPGVGAVTFGGSATYTNLVSFHTAVAAANADVGDMAYVTTPTAEGKLRSNAKLLGGATTVAAYALWEGPFGPESPDGVVAGYRAASTNQIPNNQMVFGVFSEVIHALWGGYDVVVNPYTLDINAEVRITINTFGDVAIRHPQCFAVSSDSAAQ